MTPSRAEDLRFLRMALALARRGKRGAWPNPMVGCVIVRGGRVVGQGWHRRYGGPHAEAEALAAANGLARGATAYVTLEPCFAHPGKKTPPCAPALTAAGVTRVVVASRDPNPGVAGRGVQLLRQRGVRVDVGLLETQARTINAGFFERMERGRPQVILKAAMSLDGYSKCSNGRSQWITSPLARQAARRMRAECDAVLVGIGTILADNPRLTARLGRREPARVVLDTRLRCPRSARVLDGAAPTLIFSSRPGLRANAEIVVVPRKGGGLDLSAVLGELARRGAASVLVEGGPTVQAEFLRRGLVDEARVFIAPKLLGGCDDPNAAPRLRPLALKKLGPDFLCYGKVCSPGSLRRQGASRRAGAAH